MQWGKQKTSLTEKLAHIALFDKLGYIARKLILNKGLLYIAYGIVLKKLVKVNKRKVWLNLVSFLLSLS